MRTLPAPSHGIPGLLLGSPERFPLHVLVGDAVVHQGLVPHGVPGVAQRLCPQLIRLWGRKKHRNHTLEFLPAQIPAPGRDGSSHLAHLVSQQLQGGVKVEFCTSTAGLVTREAGFYHSLGFIPSGRGKKVPRGVCEGSEHSSHGLKEVTAGN